MENSSKAMRALSAGSVGIAVDLGADFQQHAATYEQLGYGSLWLSGGQLQSLDPLQEVLAATSHAVVAPGIASLDVHTPQAIRDAFEASEATSPDRLMVGMGGPQAVTVGALQAMQDAVDDLDVGTPPIPAARRLLAALGPRKLELARERFAGAITLLTVPDHTRLARRNLGDTALVVHQMAVLDTDPDRARQAARRPLGFLATVGGYAANFRRMGFTDEDISGLSDRLVDAVVAWGDADQIAERLDQHRGAGADHVVLSLLPADGGLGVPEAASRLAPVLLG